MTLDVDFSGLYGALKDFQRATVDHVAERFYGTEPVNRFLVADEVGLGKTLVAAGVIARTIEHHLTEGTERIDVIYVCSNGDIARQNTTRLVSRLALPELERVRPIDRMTLLPQAVHDLNSRRINVVALTPGTSFNLRSTEGIARERMLLRALLWQAWGGHALRGRGGMRVFAGWAEEQRFADRAKRYQREQDLDEELVGDFIGALEARDRRAAAASQPTLLEEFGELKRLLRRHREHDRYAHAQRRAALIGELRELLARVCIHALTPELVILDEFQRFKGLLDGTDPASDLADVLFDYPDVRTLLLSATPYKMYTLADESGDDHYADLARTLEFLAGAETAEAFAEALRGFRRALLTLDTGASAIARDAKARLETTLRRVMVRTERLASTEDRRGMLHEHPRPRLPLTVDDLRGYLTLERVSELAEGGSVLEFWKDTAYPLNFMEDYKLTRALDRVIDDPDTNALLAELLGEGGSLLDWHDVTAYERLDPDNARLRWLLHDVVESGTWQLAWLPPALPYYQLEPPWSDPRIAAFTKRLVFSAWKVVPKVIAALLSYEAERRMLTAGGTAPGYAYEERQRFSPLLQLTRSGGRLTGMPVFGLLYPCPRLAALGDPRAIAADLGGGGEPVSGEAVLAVARDRVAEALGPRLRQARGDGPVDEAWYWAAPLLLDVDADDDGRNAAWWADPDLASHWPWHEEGETPDRSAEGWAEHVARARQVVTGEGPALGRPPGDLVEVLAELAVASPGVAALRALGRLVGSEQRYEVDLRAWAAYVAWGIRSLFNQPELTGLLRARVSDQRRREETFWRLVLRYCIDGCLQAVLDEYAHVLPESLGVAAASAEQKVTRVAEAMREAVSIRTANYATQQLRLDDGVVRRERRSLRGHFALRFGDERSEQEERAALRQSSIRAAFNSPFWPFVLATTSVGQEGLDFHTYCHAVVHWNLPANPVDLEQREGRVHRYKGHAVRKNVAAAHRPVAFGSEPDPWAALFAAASASREAHLFEIVPYWVYAPPGGARIERHVPALPLSRDIARLKALRRSLAAYRLVFGQPRQDDLVAYLQQRFDDEEIRALLDELRIDLSPPTPGGPSAPPAS